MRSQGSAVRMRPGICCESWGAGGAWGLSWTAVMVMLVVEPGVRFILRGVIVISTGTIAEAAMV